MYSLKEIFTNSKYDSAIFSEDEIKAIEEKIFLKKIRDKEYPYIKCLKRDKEIRLTPEEAVRQLYLYRLINSYGYSTDQIAVEHGVNFGREVKRADIVIFEKDHPTTEYIIVELKRPKLSDGKGQLKSYCNATGATMGVWTNGEKISFYQRKAPNYFEDIPDIPKVNQKLKDILTERWTIADLVKHDKLINEGKTLAELILEMEDEVLANAGVDVFEEVFKLIYTKLYDESESGKDKTRVLEFRNYGDSDDGLKETIQDLFNEAKDEWSGIFEKDSKIKLTPSHLAICISSLQDVKLFNSNLDVVDEAFEYLMNKSQKGEKGQYFTPRYVIDMCVKMLNPKKNESMIDTAAGSCGFPVHTIFHVWKSILNERGTKISHLFTAEDKPPECKKFAERKIFAIDFDEKAVRVARTLNLIAGDGKTNVLWLNTLDYERWTEVLDDEDWKDIYYDGWKRFKEFRRVKNSNCDFDFDIVMANPPFAGDIKESKIIMKYDIAKKSEQNYQSKIGRDILFIERNLQFLKPGGRMAIVLPQGRFNNSSDKYIRDFIAERCRILAVVGLHGNVFKPHTGTKTSVLFVQKWHDKLCPRREDYPIFFATMQKPSKDNSGEKIFVTNEDGTNKLDSHGHLIVDHDLFNHESLTQDGIAEAFIEFAKREKLSFFESSSFDEVKYKNLLEELECTEIKFSSLNEENRIDPEYYSKKFLSLENHLDKLNCLTINNFAYVTDGIHESIDFDDNSKINLISAKAPKENYFDLSGTGYISKIQHENNLRTILQENDVIISTVGTIGNCAVVNKKILPANSDRHVGIIRIRKNFYPRYLSTFLLSKYGRYQTTRNITGNVQPNLFIYKIKEIKVPQLSKDFQQKIEKMISDAENLIDIADELYQSAEKILIHSLGLENFSPSTQNISIKSFSDSFIKSGRLDAEYYQAKYEECFALLNKFSTTSISQEYQIFKNSGTNYSDGISDVGVIKTKQIKNQGVNINGVESYFDYATCVENKSTFLENGDVIFATMGVGSLGKVSLFEYDGDKKFVTDSTLRIYRTKKNSKIRPEVLCLFLQTKLAQEIIYRYVVGSTGIINIYDNDMEKIPIPIINEEIQEKISSQIKKSFALRRESEKLLEEAKILVENAIEHGEK
ncbi:MAG: N-6 DNA methylase [Selenomonadaceae bacterium]|nr:N-6 DNA methylase [Selenomonadaceae bacterium]